jgi:hypothetical protein
VQSIQCHLGTKVFVHPILIVERSKLDNHPVPVLLFEVWLYALDPFVTVSVAFCSVFPVWVCINWLSTGGVQPPGIWCKVPFAAPE